MVLLAEGETIDSGPPMNVPFGFQKYGGELL